MALQGATLVSACKRIWLTNWASQLSIFLKLKSSGKGTLVERLVAAAKTGRKWLTGANADILLWGEVSPVDGFITLHFLPA